MQPKQVHYMMTVVASASGGGDHSIVVKSARTNDSLLRVWWEFTKAIWRRRRYVRHQPAK